MGWALLVLIAGVATLFVLARQPRPSLPKDEPEETGEIRITAELVRGPARYDEASGEMFEYSVDVVGESNYQQALEQLAGGRTKDGVNVAKKATLVLEGSNPHDPLAVRVDIDGVKVGYLARPSARAHRQTLESAGTPHRNATCPALITGGWDRGQKGRGHFGVKLDLCHME
jgi:hypothetical protein